MDAIQTRVVPTLIRELIYHSSDFFFVVVIVGRTLCLPGLEILFANKQLFLWYPTNRSCSASQHQSIPVICSDCLFLFSIQRSLQTDQPQYLGSYACSKIPGLIHIHSFASLTSSTIRTHAPEHTAVHTWVHCTLYPLCVVVVVVVHFCAVSSCFFTFFRRDST